MNAEDRIKLLEGVIRKAQEMFNAGDLITGTNGLQLMAVDIRSLEAWEVEAQTALGED